MPRFTLRNKHKIVAHYDGKTFKMIFLSLKMEFQRNKEIKTEKVEGEPYQLLVINDEGHTCGLIAFYVIRKTYDVYLLAFKEFIG